MATAVNHLVETADFVADCYADPLAFVLGAYPWGEPGSPLADAEGPDKWQRELLRSIGEEVARNGFDGRAPVRPIRRAVSSGHGIGKAGPYSQRLETPDGERIWGTIQPGDRLFGADGSWVTVIARHEQGVRPIWRVTFDDGSSTLCDLDHLWTVRGRQERRTGRMTWRTISTEELLRLGVRRSNGRVTARQWEVPRQGAARWIAPEQPLPPYVMGLWLGDGSKGVPGWEKPYPEPVERVRHLGVTVTERAGGTSKYLPGMMSAFRSLPVFSLGSHERYIPEGYKYGDVEQRRELLRGLLDSDGECGKQGSVGYSTTSQRLADDVVWLVRSLGGKASRQPAVKEPFYTQDGKRVAGRPCYRLTLALDWNPFSIEHKRARWHKPEARYLSRWIDSIEYSHDEPAMCVTVSAPDGLYLTSDFIPTHNSTIAAWLVDWIMSTRPHAQGTVTANTYVQLETKTWAAIKRWTAMSLTADWFTVGDHRMYHRDHKDSWFCAPQSCKEENSEAFAGQHAATSTSFYVFDEDSGVPDGIHEVSEGGLTDGEPMVFRFGNCTRNTGDFYTACFGRSRDLWRPVVVDSRESRFTNKTQIQEWIDTYGEDSDFVRVRVRGLPPRASELQWIDQQRVYEAQKRPLPAVFGDDPLVVGVDVSDGGAAWNVIRFRRGADARSIPPIRIPGEMVRGDRSMLLAKLADVLTQKWGGCTVSHMFVDSAFGAPYVVGLQSAGHSNVTEIRFGGGSPDRHYANHRSLMWAKMKDWLLLGAIDEKDQRLEVDLTAPGYHMNRQDKLVLESKEDMIKRGADSPDDGDALALTFAVDVKPTQRARSRVQVPAQWGWS